MRTKQKKVDATAHDGAAVDLLLQMGKGCNQLSGRSARKGGGISGAGNKIVHNSVPVSQICCIICSRRLPTAECCRVQLHSVWIDSHMPSQTFYYPGSALTLRFGKIISLLVDLLP